MRIFVPALMFSTSVLLGLVGSASAAPWTTTRTVFEGQVATATWEACETAGCFETTATAQSGTWERDGVGGQITQMTVDRSPAPTPAGIWQVIHASFQSSSVDIAQDLSGASASGVGFILSQDCSPDGCFPGSVTPLGFADFDASWTAVAAATRFHESSRRSYTSRFGEECIEAIRETGRSRAADASLDIASIEGHEGWNWELGSLTSASSREVKIVTTTRCRHPV